MDNRYESYVALRIKHEGHILHIAIDNPPLNAMTPDAHAELGTIFSVADADTGVRVIVLTGEGEKAFCAGGNLRSMIENFGDTPTWQLRMAEARAIIVGMLECGKPIISRINGHAMGLGASIALAGDITIIVDDAKIGDSHVDVGLATGDGGALLWPALVGLPTARRYLMSGEPLRGAEAASLGLVTESTARDTLDERVDFWTTLFLAKSPIALQTTKRALNLDIVVKAKAHMDEMLRLETQSWQSPNHIEAVSAILEKRSPKFEDE
ncbi:MAG: enoyl-CoA hydratase-related protein [Sphingorhabdus sp.]